MSEIHKTCYDKILPSDLRRLAQPAFSLSADPNGRARIALLKAKKWPNGSRLQVRFMGGTSDQHDMVKQFASLWSEFANLWFDFNNAMNAEIRITFNDDGAWSYIGTDCLDIPLHAATMNLGWLDEGVILHEFGHAIGLIHEHQNPKPEGRIQWNRENVMRELSGPPNNWTPEQIERNVFQKYDIEQLNASELDPKSIMMYAIPQHWTSNDFHTERNEVLSEIDKEIIGTEPFYPRDGDDAVELTVAQMQPVEAEIGQSGEQDLYKFTAATIGRYTIETAGPTDMVMFLYGPDSQTHLIDEDDDSGTNRNAKIITELTATGTYFVQVRHYNSAGGTGSYSISVTK